MAWVRLWDDMPTDPKWRVIARRSGRSIAEVVAVFNFMMVQAGRNNGSINGWSDEDVAAALDMESEHVIAIREAMQGKVLGGDCLTGWEKRQPKRHDDSTQRTREYRERKRDDAQRDVTHGDASVTQRDAPDTDTDTDTDTEQNRTESPRAALDREFDEQFWPEYPLKKSRGSAERAYRTARKLADLPTILAALRRQKVAWDDPKYTKHAATWLNGKCWLDDAATPPAASDADKMAARRSAYAAVKKAGGTPYWNPDWGPKPDSEAA